MRHNARQSDNNSSFFVAYYINQITFSASFNRRSLLSFWMHEHESMRSKLLVPNLPVYRLLNQYLSASAYEAPFVKKII